MQYSCIYVFFDFVYALHICRGLVVGLTAQVWLAFMFVSGYKHKLCVVVVQIENCP